MVVPALQAGYPMGAERVVSPKSKDLRALVDSRISNADVPGIRGEIIGAIAPHAEYVYSGRVAGPRFGLFKNM